VAHVSDRPDKRRIAETLFEYQKSCQCESCLSELIMTGLRYAFLYRNAPCGEIDPKKWRHSMAVCEPFTPIEAALLDTNDEQLIERALVSLMEKELRARHEADFSHEVQGRPRGTSCAAAIRH
jgi:hypothetical protein